jgi:glycosyltransferase involved in cell wall biosynthesis
VAIIINWRFIYKNKENRGDNMKLAIVTNIISPYRVSLFSRLSKFTGIELTVYSGAKTHKHRKWVIKDENDFKHKVLKGIVVNLATKSNDPICLHIQPSIFYELYKDKIDVVICVGYTPFTPIISFLFCKIFKKPFILWCGTTMQSEQSKKNPFNRFVKKIIIKKSNACLAYGSYAKDFLIKYGAKDKNIFICSNAVDNEFFFKCTKRYKKETGQIKKQLVVGQNKIILYIGQLIDRKGIFDLLKAFKLVKKEIQNVSLLIIGSGPIEIKLKQYCRENKLTDVLFMGFKQKDELIKHYAIADIFVLPSSNEVWGLVINEAMACGLPIITTNQVGASGDIVKNGVNGYIIEPKDSEMLSKKMLKILKNDNLKEQMGQRSRQIIEDWGIKQGLNGTLKAINHIQKK